MNDNKNCVLEPEGFMEVIGQFTSQFEIGQQQDAQEFLVYLLDQVHEDLNRASKKSEREDKGKVESKNLSSLGAEEAAKNAWKNYLIDNKSIIVDIFQGQIRSLLRCKECNNSSLTFDPVMYFSLPFPENLPADKEVSVVDLINEFTKAEQLESKMSCKVCEKKSLYEKKIDLWKAPNILIIHLKRFKFSREQQGVASKIRNSVTYPLRDLDLSEFVIGFQRLKPQYNLFAVCVCL
jgi:ubiquitin carboxyl-terminal hydrolase 8